MKWSAPSDTMQEPPSAIHCLYPLLFALLVAGAAAGEPYRPAIDPAHFTHVVTHPYFPLTPGTVATYLEKDLRETRESRWEVTRSTRTILGVKCITVRETVTRDGLVVEETTDWFAQDREGSVWYFGEATREYLSGGRVTTLGSWEAGIGGAQPGIVMPARLTIGARHRHAYSAGVAEDIVQLAGLGETAVVPAGTYQGCLRTREWSMLESGTSRKWYAKGVGFVRSEATGGEVVTLISFAKR